MLGRFWRELDRILKIVMAAFLFAMAAITFFDVLGRYVFSMPIPGGFEMVQYLMALVVFASLPLTTAADSHLAVSLLPPSKTGTLGYIHRLFIRALSAIAIGVITWRMAEQGMILQGSQQISGYLQLPLAPIAFAMAALAAIAFVIILGKFVAALLGGDDSLVEPSPLPQQVD